MDKQRIVYLLSAWKSERLTVPEWHELQEFLKDAANIDVFTDAALELVPDNADVPPFDERLIPLLEVALKVPKAGDEKRVIRTVPLYKHTWIRYAAAAALVGVVAGAYLFNPAHNKPVNTSSYEQKNSTDILPGTQQATLTLSDGKQVTLNNNDSGTIADANINIRQNNGELAYPVSDKAVMNRMSTPRGGQYKLVLSDGTNVWLNAASSITYPTAFTGNERKVSVQGEVYFEVAKDKSKRFIVQTGTDTIVVYGTKFNVKAYNDDGEIKTSLLEGSVKVNSRLISPGQAYINGNVVSTDIGQDIAWKNGIFDFNNADLTSVMRQLGRWYNVSVSYPEGVPSMIFGGKIGRNLTLEQILKILTKSEVRFDVDKEKRQITVHKN